MPIRPQDASKSNLKVNPLKWCMLALTMWACMSYRMIMDYLAGQLLHVPQGSIRPVRRCMSHPRLTALNHEVARLMVIAVGRTHT